jgi:hypothetical protein
MCNLIHCTHKWPAVAEDEDSEDTTKRLKDLDGLNSDLMEWAREEAMAAFTCPLLGMFLTDWVVVGISIDVYGLNAMN